LSGQALTARTLILGALLGVTILGFALALVSQFGSQGAASPDQEGWVPLASTAPTDVLASAMNTPLYRASSSATKTRLGQALHTSHLGTPHLVHAYHAQPGTYDVWVIPLAQDATPGQGSSSAHVIGLFDLDYDQSLQRVRAVSISGPFVQGDPGYSQPFPILPAQAATARFSAHAQSTNLAIPQQADLHPQLIYFSAALDKITGPHPSIVWNGGGQFPDLAVWRMADSEGRDFIVGIDGAVYSSDQLPTR
jgi:hypothetical protein